MKYTDESFITNIRKNWILISFALSLSFATGVNAAKVMAMEENQKNFITRAELKQIGDDVSFIKNTLIEKGLK